MRVRITDENAVALEAEIERVDRNVRVSVSEAEGGRKLTVRVTVDVDGADGLAKALRDVVEEIRALPPEGWRRCTEKPAIGTRVSALASYMPEGLARGTVLEYPATASRLGHPGRVWVLWDNSESWSEPGWGDLFVEEKA